MARVWAEWRRRKRVLDRQMAAAMAVLSSTEMACPLPPADCFVISAIADGTMPFPQRQESLPAAPLDAHQTGNSDARLDDTHIDADRMHTTEAPFDASAACQSVVWPGFPGQCAYTTTCMNTALEELWLVRRSDGLLYDDFLELRLHPSEIMDDKQLLVTASDHLKLTFPLADTLALCEISYLQVNREALFNHVGALSL